MAFVSCSANRLAFCYALATALIFGGLFGFINSAQQIFIDVYALGAWFPVLFAVLASMMAISSFLNSRLVGRFGMRGLSHFALFGYIAATTISGSSGRSSHRCRSSRLSACFGAAMFMFGWIGPNFKRARHGAARPCRRHSLVGAGVPSDARRRG